MNKKYFGKETKEVQNLRRMVANRETTIAEYKAMDPKEAKWKEIKTRNYKIGGVDAQIRNTLLENNICNRPTNSNTCNEQQWNDFQSKFGHYAWIRHFLCHSYCCYRGSSWCCDSKLRHEEQ